MPIVEVLNLLETQEADKIYDGAWFGLAAVSEALLICGGRESGFYDSGYPKQAFLGCGIAQILIVFSNPPNKGADRTYDHKRFS